MLTNALLIALVVLLVIAIGIGLFILVRRSQGSTQGNSDQLAGLLQGLMAAQASAQSDLTSRFGNLSESLAARLATIDAAQKGISDLSHQVVGLRDVFNNKQARGAFGEVQLADIIQNIMAPNAYEFQATLSNGKRVDCLLRLPNPPGHICVDAKFPLEAWRALEDATDDVSMNAARKEFTAAIKAHIKSISEKYIIAGETADSALMFLPSEAVFAELHANFPALVEEAAKAKVWIVSPTTMMATLTTMRAVLRDVRMREKAHVVQARVAQLVDDINRLDVRVANFQKHLEQSTDDLRQIRITADKLLKRSADIIDIGLSDDQTASPELTEAA